MRPYNISFHTPTTRSSQSDFSFKEVNQHGNGLAIGHCFLISCTTEFHVADVLPDVVKSWVDGLRIPFRDIGVRLAKFALPPRLELTSHLANAYKVYRSDLRVSFLRTIRPSPWSFVRCSFTSLVTIRNGKYIIHLFFPFNCEFLLFVVLSHMSIKTEQI